MPAAKTWREVRGQRPLNEARVAAYGRVLGAQIKLAELRRRRGMSQATIAAALDVSQPNVSRIESEDNVYLSTLARYVAALGGHVEVNAVFPDDTVTLLRAPEEIDG